MPVEQNTKYEFSRPHYTETGEIEGAGGPHFTVQDMYSPTAIYFDSDELKDAGFWKLSSGIFTTGPDCKLLVVHVRRLPAGSPIRGKLWIDDFLPGEEAAMTVPIQGAKQAANPHEHVLDQGQAATAFGATQLPFCYTECLGSLMFGPLAFGGVEPWSIFVLGSGIRYSFPGLGGETVY